MMNLLLLRNPLKVLKMGQPGIEPGTDDYESSVHSR